MPSDPERRVDELTHLRWKSSIRHMRLPIVLTLASAVLMVTVLNSAQDTEFVQQWEKAQKDRPQELASVARIADSQEPGEPLHIRGRLYLSDGVTPAPHVIVFAWQTDRRGVYNQRGEEGWRLRGWTRTDSDGRFEFQTIRPGSYPGRSTPAHVHFTVEGPGLQRRWTSELLFANDPFVTATEKDRSATAGRFGWVRPVGMGPDGIEIVEINLKASEEGIF